MSSQADHTCILAVHKQWRIGQVRQIGEHAQERIERKEDKDITGHGCRGNISPTKSGLHPMLHSHKTHYTDRTDHNEPNDKACVSRRTNSDQHVCKWISQVPQVSWHWRIRRRIHERIVDKKTRRNDCERSSCRDQTSKRRDDYE